MANITTIGVQYVIWAFTLLLLMTYGEMTFSPLIPPSYPLAVRTPYLSAWLPGHMALNLPSSSPQFWFGNNLTWSVIARVDGHPYTLFGVSNELDGSEGATVIGGRFTSTHSIFTLTAGPRNFTLDFLSPVSPKNLLRQSLPLSYLTVMVGVGHGDVQVYSDIDSSWTGQADNAAWNFTIKDDTYLYTMSPNEGDTFVENDKEQALWGETVYATRSSAPATFSYASGPSFDIRSQFVHNGSLRRSNAPWSADGVVGFAHDLGVPENEIGVTFVIGHVREEVIDYVGNIQTGYYRTVYPDTISAVSHFLDDYDEAASESVTMDLLVQQGGESSYGVNYSDILALSLRQIYGGIELVVPRETMNVSDAQAFIKEISSNGNINTVDVIYATFPALYTLSPNYIKLLLRPVFNYMGSRLYKEPFAVHDLGTHYPNATGHVPDGQKMPIEECGNIIILTYAYQIASGEDDFTLAYASLLKQYAEYLQKDGKYPTKQLSLNDALGEMANQTNLAMKAATALTLYGKLTHQQNYFIMGKSIADAIYKDRLGTDPNGTYFTMQYGKDTWFLVYNHYADVLFNADIFPKEVYEITSRFYPSVRKPAGVALNGDIDWGQTNWQGFVAATVYDEARTMLIADMHAYISNGLNQAPFSDRYWVQDNNVDQTNTAGHDHAFRGRPTLGSHFALMALHGGDRWQGIGDD
ncbi:hypothetical protein FE257_001386 [Aspergillus nanangensis]|uniref:Glutaminase n=1 Tax=Aspergillus nanangensis TaxID=2582783 RepID=A0AAD4CE67_ASPNN|nr:hypothetical protein FE257_001386 [Aspergillus nanangensis]